MNVNDPENDTVAALLNGLRPAAPSDDLMRRLAAARPVLRVVTRREKIILFIPRLATAAAVLALMGAISYKILPRLLRSSGGESIAQEDKTGRPGPGSATYISPVAAAAVSPMQSRQRLLGVQDIGVTLDSQQNAVRLMRAQWWDDETFTPSNGAPPVRQERLREEIVPVAVSTF